MGVGVAVTEELRDYFDRHVPKLSKLLRDRGARLDVEFQHLSEKTTDDKFRVECMMRAPGLEMRAEARAATLHAAIDQAVETLSFELRKAKGKRLKLFRLEGLTWKNWLRFGRKKNI